MKVFAPLPLPLKQFAKIVIEHAKYVENLERKGVVKFTAIFLGKRARVMILDVESDIQLFDALNSDPLFNYSDREIHPLISHENAYTRYESLLKK